MSPKPASRHASEAFAYRAGALHCDGAELERLAERFGTPLYVYGAAAIRERLRIFKAAFQGFPHTVCYSVKANSNLSILKMLAQQEAGFDVVSGGELERVARASRSSVKNVVFSGVGKTSAEIDLALRLGILIFNVESESELGLLARRAAALKMKARVALRVNPDVFADTHPYISTGLREHKFGVDIGVAPELYRRAAGERYLEVAGVSVHIGSQITAVEPFAAALERVADLVRQLRGEKHNIRWVDAGGGLGISYHHDQEFDFPERVRHYAASLTAALAGLDVHLLLEPGRAIIAPAGALLTRVLYTKRNGSKRFAIVDAAMNDLIRPSLYKAHHEIVTVTQSKSSKKTMYDVVGPICETGDFFARDRELPELHEGDLLALLDAGAYGFSLSSNYNTRPRPAEVMVEGKTAKVIRKRETMKDLLRAEQ